MVFPKVWFLRNDVRISYYFGKILLSDLKFGIQNARVLALAECALRDATKSLSSDDVFLPENFPLPRLALPKKKFAPDYFCFGSYSFCSRRLREAMALPDSVVQYAPVDLVVGGDAARTQDYRLLRVVAIQSAMDLERSECELEDWTNRLTGEQSKRPCWIDRFALLGRLQPLTDIFRIAEARSYVLVTDALAERVLRAGCTGIEFSDPTNPQHGHRTVRYRTADGYATREV